MKESGFGAIEAKKQTLQVSARFSLKTKKANPHVQKPLALYLPTLNLCPFCGAINPEAEEASDFITY